MEGELKRENVPDRRGRACRTWMSGIVSEAGRASRSVMRRRVRPTPPLRLHEKATRTLRAFASVLEVYIIKPMQQHRSFYLLIVIVGLSLSGSYAVAEPLLYNFTDGKTKILELSSGRKEIKEIYSFAGNPPSLPAFSAANDMLIFKKAKGTVFLVVDVRGRAIRELTKTENCDFPAFTRSKDILFFICDTNPKEADDKKKNWEVQLFDLSKMNIIKKVSGTSPAMALKEDAIFFLGNFDVKKQAIPLKILDLKTLKEETMKEVTLSSEGGPYEVTEILGFSRFEYFYKIYDEHEYRFYRQDDNALFRPSAKGKEEPYKEQYDLTISDDGKLAAFTERNWNELTYLVVGDAKSGSFYRTNIFGSFPTIDSNTVYFFSDPAFVKAKFTSTEFRQIKQFTLYAYEPKTKALSEIRRFKGIAGFLKY